MKKPTLCPCGKISGKYTLNYAECCGLYVDDYEHTPAPDAESLMRSRYTAFVLERSAYLLDTWDPAHSPAQLDFEPGIKWLGLTIRDTQALDPEHAEVEFVARSRIHGKGHRLHERSRFIRRNGRWFYVDGHIYE